MLWLIIGCLCLFASGASFGALVKTKDIFWAAALFFNLFTGVLNIYCYTNSQERIDQGVKK